MIDVMSLMVNGIHLLLDNQNVVIDSFPNNRATQVHSNS